MGYSVGVELAIPVIDRLSLLQEETGPIIKERQAAVRWNPVTDMRLTLRAFRHLEASAYTRVQDMVQDFARALTPFRFECVGSRAEREPGMACLITADIREEGDTLQALQEHINRAADMIGFMPDTRPWKPRVLIGRLATPRGAANLDELFDPYQHTVWGETECKELVLYESKVMGRMAQTRAIRRFQIGSGR